MTHSASFCRIIALLAILALALSGCAGYRLNPAPAPQVRAEAQDVVSPREIVVLVPNAIASVRLLKGATERGFVLRDKARLRGLGLRMHRFDIPAPLDSPGAIAVLEAIEPSATAGVNHAFRPVAQAQGRGGALDYANSLMRWPAQACRALGPIGMIDTGVDSTIPELAGVRIVSERFHRGAAAPLRHGTEVAAVLADPRRLSGVTLYSAAVFGVSARRTDEAGVDSLLKALDWMAADGVRLVNVSLAGPYNKLLDRGIDVASAHGMTVVAAVGNDGAGANPRYPAALDNVIAVTAVDAAGAIYLDAIQGGYVDVAAPGVDVMVSTGGQRHFVSGTSIATPFVTARIASDPAFYPGSAATIRGALGGSTVDLGAPGRDPVYGAGLLIAHPACRSD